MSFSHIRPRHVFQSIYGLAILCIVFRPSSTFQVKLFACGLILAATIPSLGNEQLLERAIDQYQTALDVSDLATRLDQFSTAQQLFEQVIQEQLQAGAEPPPELWINFGNAALQARNIGKSILAFRHALAVDPDNEQALQNLAYARSLVPAWAQIVPSRQLSDTLFFWRGFFSNRQIQWAAAWMFVLAGGLVGIGLATRRSLWRNLAVFPLLLWLALLTSSLVHVGGETRNAVVVADETVMYSADSENSSPRISEPLPGGAELTLLQQRERWSEVRFDGRSGWVRTAAIARVSEDSPG